MNEKIILKDSLLEACQSSYVPNIMDARKKILALPRKWVIENIHSISQEILNLSEEWEYRRLLEVYKELDEDLLEMLVASGLKSDNEEVREAATDFQP